MKWERHASDAGIRHRCFDINNHTLAEIFTSDYSGKRVVIVYAYDKNCKMSVKRHTYGREDDAVDMLKKEVEKELLGT